MNANHSNVRILAKAYANQRIGRETYIALRRIQLDAIQNNESPPELPVEVQAERYSEDDTTPTEVALQTIEIMPQALQPKSQTPILAIVCVVAALSAVLALDWFVFKDSADPVENSSTDVSLGIELSAHRLMEQRNWDDQDVNAFIRQWNAASSPEKTELRTSLWFSRLNRVIEKRIAELGKLLEITGSNPQTEETLARLNALAGALNDTASPTQSGSKDAEGLDVEAEAEGALN